MSNRWFTAPQAAKELGLASFSLHRIARRGEVRFQRLGRFWLFEAREIARLRRLRASRSARQRSGEPRS